MAISKQDRRMLAALRAATTRLRTAASTTELAAQVRAIALTVVETAADQLGAAVEDEDVRDVRAERAVDARVRAFEDLESAYRRLFAGLTLGVSLARVRGEETDEVAQLKVYLSETPPSRLRAAGFGHGLQTVRTALRFLDDFVPESERAGLREVVEAALAHADEAFSEAERRKQEAADALSTLQEARAHAEAAYLSARDLIAAALRMEGRRDRLNAVLPTLVSVKSGPPSSPRADGEGSSVGGVDADTRSPGGPAELGEFGGVPATIERG